jgi:hypothetical protein
MWAGKPVRTPNFILALVGGAALAIGVGFVVGLLRNEQHDVAADASVNAASAPTETEIAKPAEAKPPQTVTKPPAPLKQDGIDVHSRYPKTRPATYADLLKGLGGERVAAILRTPDKVEAVLLKPPDWKRGYGAHEYLVIAEPVAVDEATSKDIAEALLTPELHQIVLAAKACLPIYGVRVTYWSGDERVDLNFCFQCAILAVYHSGEAVGGMSFDFVSKRLKDDAIRIFPSEPALKNVPNRTSDGLTPIPSPEDGLTPPAPPDGPVAPAPPRPPTNQNP